MNDRMTPEALAAERAENARVKEAAGFILRLLESNLEVYIDISPGGDDLSRAIASLRAALSPRRARQAAGRNQRRPEMTPEEEFTKCIVASCPNKTDEGVFDSYLCMPCAQELRGQGKGPNAIKIMLRAAEAEAEKRGEIKKLRKALEWIVGACTCDGGSGPECEKCRCALAALDGLGVCSEGCAHEAERRAAITETKADKEAK